MHCQGAERLNGRDELLCRADARMHGGACFLGRRLVLVQRVYEMRSMVRLVDVLVMVCVLVSMVRVRDAAGFNCTVGGRLEDGWK